MKDNNATIAQLNVNEIIDNGATTVEVSRDENATLLKPEEALDLKDKEDAPVAKEAKSKHNGLKYAAAAGMGLGVAAVGAYAVEGTDVNETLGLNDENEAAAETDATAEEAIAAAETDATAEEAIAADGAATAEEIRDILLGDATTEEAAAEEAAAEEVAAEVATEEVATEEAAEVAAEEAVAEEAVVEEVAAEEAAAEEVAAEVATEE
ncbi:MAG: hypothetical protein IJB56_05575, partial [Alistipes sp.]|nr:hypothetical protein [Alistipes sp.]